jgi:hypothetical protein
MVNKTNTGHYSTGDCSTGNRSTGYHSTGNYSTGNYSTGDWSTGYHSTGDWSTGNRSTGHCSTGDYSTGDWSTGDWSTGDRSTGYRSTGNYSTGYWSTSNYSTGHFSTIDEMGFSAFNKPCTREQWAQADIPSWLYFNLTEWVDKEDMTDLEKQDHPTYETTGGYLKVYEYQEAWEKSYDNATREEQLKIKSLPNFDAEVFYEISGIKIDEGLSNPKEITIEGATYRLVEEVYNG